MRKRFLVLSCVAAMSLASLATSAFAATLATVSISCTGPQPYNKTYSLTVPPTFKPYSYTYSVVLDGGLETCTVTATTSTI
jgi:hypothetical protein